MTNTSLHKSSSSHPIPPLWRLGFRPFFLAALIFALIAISIWIAAFSGVSLGLGGMMSPLLWHAHEMVYGYSTAVIAGFVLTASQNWTGRSGVKGKPLGLLVFIWLLGRISMFMSTAPNYWASILDLSFIPSLAAFMIPYLSPKDMKVERVFFVYFGLYFFGNLSMHLDALGVLPGYGMKGAILGLHTTILMIIFMGGRLIPFFSESEKSRIQPRTFVPLEVLSHASAWVFLLTQYFGSNSILSGSVAILAGLIHLGRLRGWYVKRVRRVAILWILYSSYFWISIGFILSGLNSFGHLALGPPTHAFTIGGIGIMTYGMISRVSLGHTGRKLIAGRSTIFGYVLLNLACALRVIGPIVSEGHMQLWVTWSGVFWIVSFALLLVAYAPMLLRARIDDPAA